VNRFVYSCRPPPQTRGCHCFSPSVKTNCEPFFGSARIVHSTQPIWLSQQAQLRAPTHSSTFYFVVGHRPKLVGASASRQARPPCGRPRPAAAYAALFPRGGRRPRRLTSRVVRFRRAARRRHSQYPVRLIDMDTYTCIERERKGDT